jgi:ribose 5-phosphate isomerase A
VGIQNSGPPSARTAPDCDFGPIADPGALATDLSAIPGVLDHGLFVDLADEIHCGTDDGVRVETV